MYILLDIIIFAIVLFFYIHIFYHIKTSNYLEIYEIDYVSKEKFEELCDLKQPILLTNYDTNNQINIDLLLQNYSSFDIKIIKNNYDIELPLNLLITFKPPFMSPPQRLRSL